MIDFIVQNASSYWDLFTFSSHVFWSLALAAIGCNVGGVLSYLHLGHLDVEDFGNSAAFGFLMGFSAYWIVPGLPIILGILVAFFPAILFLIIKERSRIANWAIEKKNSSSIINWIRMQREVILDSKRSAHKP